MSQHLGGQSFEKLDEIIKKYDEKNQKELVRWKQYPDGHHYVVVSDKFCWRIHQSIPWSADISFVDSTDWQLGVSQ